MKPSPLPFFPRQLATVCNTNGQNTSSRIIKVQEKLPRLLYPVEAHVWPKCGAARRGGEEAPGVDPDLAHERIYIRLLPLIKQSQKDSNGATPHSLSLSLSRRLPLFFTTLFLSSIAASFVYHFPLSLRS